MTKKSDAPAIRFKGFSDAWEQRKFSDVVATRRGLTYKPSDIRKNGVRVLRSSNIAEDSFVLSDEDVFVVREAVNIDCVRANDILITAANGSSRLVGKHTIISGIPEESAVHGGFMLLGTTKEPHFVNASMGSSWYRRFIELFVAGGNGAIGNLNKNDLDNQDIAIPSEKEQKKIGSFFRQLDNLITLHQRKCVFLFGFFQAFISMIFTASTFSWEQRKLASLCEKFTDGDWIESKDQSDFGVRLVQTGNVGVAEYLDKPNNKKWISEDTFDRLHCEEVLPGDILISRLPEPAGRACIMPLLGAKMITAVDCTIVRTAPDMSNKFLVQYLSSQAYFDDVNICLAGGTRQRISRGNLANFDVPIPVKKSEQDAIGMFFGYLDNLITLHQRKPFLMKWRTSDANRNQTNRLVL